MPHSTHAGAASWHNSGDPATVSNGGSRVTAADRSHSLSVIGTLAHRVPDRRIGIPLYEVIGAEHRPQIKQSVWEQPVSGARWLYHAEPGFSRAIQSPVAHDSCRAGGVKFSCSCRLVLAGSCR